MNQAQYIKLAEASLPKHYRRILSGEMIQPGDVCYDDTDDKWNLIFGGGFVLEERLHMGFYARSSKPPEPAGPVPGLPGWRYLNSGEQLQENDIFSNYDGRWYETSCVGTVLAPPQVGRFARLSVLLVAPNVPAGYALLKRGEHVAAGDIVRGFDSTHWSTPRTADEAEFINKRTARLDPDCFYARPTDETVRRKFAEVVKRVAAETPTSYPIPDGYRMLGAEEALQAGDKFWHDELGDWSLTWIRGNTAGQIFPDTCVIRPDARYLHLKKHVEQPKPEECGVGYGSLVNEDTWPAFFEYVLPHGMGQTRAEIALFNKDGSGMTVQASDNEAAARNFPVGHVYPKDSRDSILGTSLPGKRRRLAGTKAFLCLQ